MLLHTNSSVFGWVRIYAVWISWLDQYLLRNIVFWDGVTESEC